MKRYYLLSAILLIISALMRTLEPRLLQVAIDGVVGRLSNQQNTLANSVRPPQADDAVANAIYALLPTLQFDNFGRIMLTLGLLMVIVSLLRGISLFTSGVLNARVTERVIGQLRDRLFAHLQSLPLAFFGKYKTGELIQRCTGDVETVKGFIHSQITDFILLLSTFVFAFGMMWGIHPQYAAIGASAFPILVVAAYFFFKNESTVWEAHEAEQDKLTSLVEENLSGVRVVKAFAKEDLEIHKFDAQNKRTFDVGMRHAQLHAYFWTCTDFVIFLQATISILAGGWYATTQQITVGELVTFYGYVWMLSFPMRQLGRVISQLGMTRVALTRLSEILHAEPENYKGMSLQSASLNHSDKMPASLRGDIVFQNVSFAYPSEESKIALQNVSFDIRAGQKVAFMGTTGAGKSTIVQLLLRFYEPQEGQIFLDGLPIQHYDKGYLRKRIGVVPQRPFLFSATIAQNIAYARPDATSNDIEQAAQDAAIHEVNELFAKGYETMVGEKGVSLSGGQKQRVTLARTLLENADLLVLDDTTSAVDAETEAHIQQTLRQAAQQKTSLLIANRISSVADADQIIVLDKGRVVQQGTHEQLLKQENGFYARVYAYQAIAVEDF